MHSKMKAAQISKPGEDFELSERDVPQPGPGQVRVKIEACGICETFPLNRVAEAFDPMQSGKVRFRAVLMM